jgi:hypothetical protein
MRYRRGLISVSLLLLACSAPLPETYGVYAHDGRHLVDLTDEETERDYQLSSSISLLVFDRSLSDPGFDPSEAFVLQRSAYSRQVHVVHLEVPADKALELLNASPVPTAQVDSLPMSITRAAPSGRWLAVGEQIPIRVGPHGERDDILALNPVEQLAPGSYLLTTRLAGKEVLWSFGVDMPRDEGQRLEDQCVDEFFYTVRKPDGFLGWDQWIRDFSGSGDGGQRKALEGRPVIAESTLPCEQTDTRSPRVLNVTAKPGPATASARVFEVEYQLPGSATDVSLSAMGGMSTQERQPNLRFADVNVESGHHVVELPVTCCYGDGPPEFTTDFLQIYFFRPSERSSFYSQRIEQTHSWEVQQR